MTSRLITNNGKPWILIEGYLSNDQLNADIMDVAKYCYSKQLLLIKQKKNVVTITTPKILAKLADQLVSQVYQPIINAFRNSLREKQAQLTIQNKDFIDFYRRFQNLCKNYRVPGDAHELVTNSPSYKTLFDFDINRTQPGLADLINQALHYMIDNYPNKLLSDSDFNNMLSMSRFVYAIQFLANKQQLKKYFEELYNIEYAQVRNRSLGSIIYHSGSEFVYLFNEYTGYTWIAYALFKSDEKKHINELTTLDFLPFDPQQVDLNKDPHLDIRNANDIFPNQPDDATLIEHKEPKIVHEDPKPKISHRKYKPKHSQNS